MTVLVLGSLNMDLVVRANRLPTAGETLMGHEFFSAFGGKGANQAVAIAKLGYSAHFIGQVGNDDFGQTLRLALQASGVNIDGLAMNPAVHSGVASIVVTDSGENTIACAPGANAMVGIAQVEALTQQLDSAQWLLLELGIPLETIVQAAHAAYAAQVPVLLDPSPVPDKMPPELYSYLEILTPNETEASQLVGFEVHDPATAQQAAQQLRAQGVTTVIITLGAQGAWCSSPDAEFLIPAPTVDVVDTVAAGDAFNGALIAALCEGVALETAVKWGVAAGSLAVTQRGAQPALPDRVAVESQLGRVIS
ncbi:MAG: ribokinase [Spirulina sp. SIO3F2]|nr:ribokinase [Spirulina sp. SIO3F2]